MSMLSIIAASRRRLDADALAYLTAVEAADTQALEPEVRTAINRFVVGCKADGIWDAIKASCILAGARTMAGCLVPLKGTAPTNVGGNFVSGDYNRKTGLVGDGSTKYLDSNRNNNADPQNSHHLAVWVTEVDTGAGTIGIIGTGGFNDGESVIAYAESIGSYLLRSRTSSFVSFTASRQTGFHGISRAQSANVNVRLPSISQSPSLTSQTPRNITIKVFARDATPYWNGRNSFYSIGESLDLSALDSRLATLMSDLNSAIP